MMLNTSDPRTVLLAAFAASACILLAALAMQNIGGLPPCKLCHWQRYPYIAVLAVASVSYISVKDRGALRWAAILCALLFAGDAGIAFYHAGVEQGWFPGPSDCTGSVSANSVEELERQIMGTPLVRCDDIPWSLFGISIAGYNAIAAAILAVATFAAAAGFRAGGEKTA